MLERLSISLFHPRIIAKFISDKFFKMFFYFGFLIILTATATFFAYSYTKEIGSANEKIILEQLRALTIEENVTMNQYRLNGTPNFSLKTSNYIFNFSDVTETNEIGITMFTFSEDRVNISISGMSISYVTYEEMNVTDFSIQKASLGQSQDKNLFLELINKSFEHSNKLFLPFNYLITIGTTAVMFLLCVFLIYLFSLNINPTIQKVFRIKIVFYASTIILMSDLVGTLFNIGFISYIGIILSYFYVTKALKSVLKIEVKKI